MLRECQPHMLNTLSPQQQILQSEKLTPGFSNNSSNGNWFVDPERLDYTPELVCQLR